MVKEFCEAVYICQSYDENIKCLIQRNIYKEVTQ